MHAFLSDYVTEMVVNAVQAGSATVRISVRTGRKRFSFSVEDDGPGLPPERRAAPEDVFAGSSAKHPCRRYGLGLGFLAQACELCGGVFLVESPPAGGTRVSAEFDLTNIDTPPIGDLVQTLAGAIAFPGNHQMTIHRNFLGGAGLSVGGYLLDRGELAAALDGFDSPGALSLLDFYIRTKEDEHGQTEPRGPAGTAGRAAAVPGDAGYRQ